MAKIITAIAIVCMFAKFSYAQDNLDSKVEDLYDLMATSANATTCYNIITKRQTPTDIAAQYKAYLTKNYTSPEIVQRLSELHPNFPLEMLSKFDQNKCADYLEAAAEDFKRANVNNQIFLDALQMLQK